MQPTRHFLAVGRRLVHYTRAGEGPPVLLLHASATSSGEMAPTQRVFARDFTAIAFDTPGYGLSEPLDLGRPPELEDYADALAEALDILGIGPAAVYGRHTGASIAVEFGRRHSARCTMVLTDGYPIWTAEERERMLGGYLPELVPSWDGAHLLWVVVPLSRSARLLALVRLAGRKARHPRRPAATVHPARRPRIPPCGDGYRTGYSAAFRHDGARALAGITVPVCLGTRPSDLIHPMRDRAPPGAWRIVAPPDPLEAAVMERSLLAMHPAATQPPAAPACVPIPGRSTPDFLNLPDSRLLMRRVPGDGETLLVIGEIPGSTAYLIPFLDALEGPAIAFDLPGLGESDVDGTFTPSVEDWAARLLAALDALDIGRVRIYAHRGGCAVATALALQAPSRISSLLLDSPLAVPEAARRASSIPTPPQSNSPGTAPTSPASGTTSAIRSSGGPGPTAVRPPPCKPTRPSTPPTSPPEPSAASANPRTTSPPGRRSGATTSSPPWPWSPCPLPSPRPPVTPSATSPPPPPQCSAPRSSTFPSPLAERAERIDPT